MAICATAIFAGTRRTRDEAFVRSINSIVEGQKVTVTTKVCDPDGDLVEILFEDVPEGVEFGDIYEIPVEDRPFTDPNCAECVADPNSSWYAIEWEWTPTFEQEGEYNIFIHAIDDKGGDDWIVHVINVANRNRPPIL